MNRFVKSLAAALPPSLLLSSFSFGVEAQEALEPVVVTATRQQTRVSEILADVTVIEREEIERAGGETVVDLLARQPGIQMTRNGGPGTSASLFVRGTRPDQTKVLVDGVPINSLDLAGSPLRFLSLADVDRIESTEVDTRITAADTWFPPLPDKQWDIKARELHAADERHDFGFDLITRTRRRS